MEFFNDHRKLFGAAAALFIGLTLLVAIFPALSNQKNNAPLPGYNPPTEMERKGKALYIANGCVGCHTQQVRNVAMDKVWGARPGIPADYAGMTRTDLWRNTATLMGTERTGPDLTDVGNRQPSLEWNLVHLFNPRIVVPASIMPAYPWLFEIKQEADSEDVVVNVPPEFLNGRGGTVVARPEALQLVAYLQFLKQLPLPDGRPDPVFLYEREAAKKETLAGAPEVFDGKALYATHCQACHQENGMGLAGAFPPLKGSALVLSADPALYVEIIMKGYDAREEYGVMPAVGEMAGLSAGEVAAIINHERQSWGNEGSEITVEEVQAILDMMDKPLARD